MTGKATSRRAHAVQLVVLATALLSADCAPARTGQAPAPPSTQPLAAGAGRPQDSVWSGVYTPRQADRGTEVVRACVACHGAGLDGSVGRAPSLQGPAFTTRWNGWTLGNLFERVEEEMTALARPPAGGPQSNQSDSPPGVDATAQKSADALAFLLRANGYPPGSVELAPDASTWRRISFAPEKP